MRRRRGVWIVERGGTEGGRTKEGTVGDLRHVATFTCCKSIEYKRSSTVTSLNPRLLDDDNGRYCPPVSFIFATCLSHSFLTTPGHHSSINLSSSLLVSGLCLSALCPLPLPLALALPLTRSVFLTPPSCTIPSHPSSGANPSRSSIGVSPTGRVQARRSISPPSWGVAMKLTKGARRGRIQSVARRARGEVSRLRLVEGMNPGWTAIRSMRGVELGMEVELA